MTGYELPLRAIREQIASAVDLIVHTARLKDGSRKIINITEVYGIEDDEILTQDIFAFEQTGISDDGKIDRRAQADRHPADVHGRLQGERGRPAARRVRDPVDRPGRAGLDPQAERAAWTDGDQGGSAIAGSDRRSAGSRGRGRGMVYVSSIGPVDPETTGFVVSGAIKEQTRQCLTNLKAKLEATGSSLDKVVWANWALREPAEFDMFNEEWVALVPRRHADRPGDADAATPAPGRVPHLDRGHRRGLGRLDCGRTTATTRRNLARPLPSSAPSVHSWFLR